MFGECGRLQSILVRQYWILIKCVAGRPIRLINGSSLRSLTLHSQLLCYADKSNVKDWVAWFFISSVFSNRNISDIHMNWVRLTRTQLDVMLYNASWRLRATQLQKTLDFFWQFRNTVDLRLTFLENISFITRFLYLYYKHK